MEQYEAVKDKCDNAKRVLMDQSDDSFIFQSVVESENVTSQNEPDMRINKKKEGLLVKS